MLISLISLFYVLVFEMESSSAAQAGVQWRHCGSLQLPPLEFRHFCLRFLTSWDYKHPPRCLATFVFLVETVSPCWLGWPQVIHLPWPPKVLELRHEPPCPDDFFVFFSRDGISPCWPVWSWIPDLVICLPQPHKVLELQAWATVTGLFLNLLFVYFRDKISLCCPGWSTVAHSWLIATSASRAEAILDE